jgi:hypothetical protein
MELSGGVNREDFMTEVSQSTHVGALTTKGPNVSVLTHVEASTAMSHLGNSHM